METHGKGSETHGKGSEELKAKVVDELAAVLAVYNKAAEHAQKQLSEETQKVWVVYWRERSALSAKALRRWAETYAEFVEVSRTQSTDASKLSQSWNVHVAACGGSPEFVAAWRALQQTFEQGLQRANSSATETLRHAADEYAKKLRSSLEAHGLGALDDTYVMYLMNQVATLTLVENSVAKAA